MRVRELTVGIILILVMVLMAACGPQATPTPTSQAAAPAAATAPAPVKTALQTSLKAAWELEWATTQEAAKKEGTLLVAMPGGPTWRSAMMKGFNEASGLRVEAVTQNNAAFTVKILAERRSGLYYWDAFTGAGVTVVTRFKPAGIIEPLDPLLVLPELTEPELVKQVWFGGKLMWTDGDHTNLLGIAFPASALAVNTDLVKDGDIRSYRDLLDPKWRGKIIVLDPKLGGNFGNTLVPMFVLGGVAGGEDWLRGLAKNDIIILKDNRLMFDWLSHGKAAIMIGPQSDTLAEFIKAGAPMKILIPQEGTALSASFGGVSAFDKRPHPNATKLFVNWFLSKEGQTLASQAIGGQSLRLDVPTKGLPPTGIRQPGVSYYMKDLEENLLRQPEVDKIVKEIFEPLTR